MRLRLLRPSRNGGGTCSSCAGENSQTWTWPPRVNVVYINLLLRLRLLISPEAYLHLTLCAPVVGSPEKLAGGFFPAAWLLVPSAIRFKLCRYRFRLVESGKMAVSIASVSTPESRLRRYAWPGASVYPLSYYALAVEHQGFPLHLFILLFLFFCWFRINFIFRWWLTIVNWAHDVRRSKETTGSISWCCHL